MVLINCSDDNLELSVPVWEIGVRTGDEMTCKFRFEDGTFSAEETKDKVKYGRLYATLPPKSGKVYSYKFIKE